MNGNREHVRAEGGGFRKAMRPNETNLHSVCCTSARGSWLICCAEVARGYFRRAYYVRASKVFHAGGQLLPEGIRVIVSRPSGKERIRGEEKKKTAQYGPQGCASLLLAYPRSRALAFVLFPRNYMNWFLIAIDVVRNINHLPRQLCRAFAKVIKSIKAEHDKLIKDKRINKRIFIFFVHVNMSQK